MANVAIYNRLSKCGIELRQAAETLREEIRRNRKAAGETRDLANQTAEDKMWEAFRPVVEQWENQQDEDGGQLSGCTEDLDQFLDPNYTETDAGKWLRDGLIWVAAEIRRVVRDTEEGTVVDLSRARTKPPTAWAVFCLESFARKPASKRGDLIMRVLPFATRSHDPTSDDGSSESSAGFMGDIEG